MPLCNLQLQAVKKQESSQTDEQCLLLTTHLLRKTTDLHKWLTELMLLYDLTAGSQRLIDSVSVNRSIQVLKTKVRQKQHCIAIKTLSQTQQTKLEPQAPSLNG